MTDEHAPEPTLPDGSTTETPSPEKPAPEPWTAAKVTEWNAYYDLYVAIGVLLLAFLGSANKITQSSTWAQIAAGRQVATTGTPVTTDTLSFTEEGHRWVHVSWLSDLAHDRIYRLVSGFAPVDPAAAMKGDSPETVAARRAQTAASEQWGAAGLIAFDALLRALTALVLLRVRHRGPGLWWSGVCAILALGVVYNPVVRVAIGGIANPAAVSSDTVGQLLLAVEVLWLFRAIGQGKSAALYGLIPLFVLWANCDESFVLGLAVLAATVAGLAVRRKQRPVADSPSLPGLVPGRGLIVLAASAAACLINPSLFRVYPAAIGSVLPGLGPSPGLLMNDQISYFGQLARKISGLRMDELRLYYATVVGVGIVSFVVNRRRLSWPRLLAFVVAALFWAVALRSLSGFAIVFAATLALNGQEWYHDRFGTEGRLGRGWASWSIGGRAATIVVVALATFKAVTGWDYREGQPQFGFGFDPDLFAFESAETLRDLPIEGNLLNTEAAQGDALLWRASPRRKTFIDSRRHLFTPETVGLFEELRKAIRDDDEETWRPPLEGLKVAAVMIPNSSTQTYQTLMASKNWVPFYDDGAMILFGRKDASAADVAYFESHRLIADDLAFRRPTLTTSSDKLPRASTDLDKIYQSRAAIRPQQHNSSAYRWLVPYDLAPNTPYMPDPAHCLMAIRELRAALAAKPDDRVAFRQLAQAYEVLFKEESALIAGIAPTPENATSINNVAPQAALLPNRLHQLLTATSYAIQTTPPPKTPEERRDLIELNFKLASLYLNQGFRDLGRDRLDAVVRESAPDDLSPEMFTGLTAQLNDLNTQLADVQNRVTNLGIEQQASPIQKAGVARQSGAVGLSIQVLEDAMQAGINPAIVKPTLIDLYCQVGQPDKALDLWTGGNVADPQLGDGPGSAALRQGRVFFLLGNYASALALWSREALPELKARRALRAPEAARALIQGEPMAATRTILELPDEVAKQSLWEFELGMASLEGGLPPEETATHLTAALTLTPESPLRPVIAYYLQKLGKPVPPDPAEARKAATAEAPTPTPAPATNAAAPPAK